MTIWQWVILLLLIIILFPYNLHFYYNKKASILFYRYFILQDKRKFYIKFASYPYDTIIIIILAIIIPHSTQKNDFFLSISSNDAIRHPVHAPVPGNGTPTNRNNPR